MNKFTIALATSACLALAACGDSDTGAEDTMVVNDGAAMDDGMMMPESGTVVDLAQANPDFSTLVDALVAAGLVETLSGEGPFTVFAPTNSAFEALPAGTVDRLVTEDTETLRAILTYHVVAGQLMAADVLAAIEGAGPAGLEVETLGGGTFTATVVDGNVMLTDAARGTAMVTATDVDGSNGVIHVIDTVMMPQ